MPAAWLVANFTSILTREATVQYVRTKVSYVGILTGKVQACGAAQCCCFLE